MAHRCETWEEQARAVKKEQAAGIPVPGSSPGVRPGANDGRPHASGTPWLAMAVSAALAAVLTFGACRTMQKSGGSRTQDLAKDAPAAAANVIPSAESLELEVAARMRTWDMARLREASLRGHLIGLSEKALGDIGLSLIQPMWLREAYKVAPRGANWMVEGIVLERPESPTAYFWAVEIMPIEEDGPEVFPPRCRVVHVVFNLSVWKGEEDGTFTRLRDRAVERDSYRKLNFE